MANLFFFFSPQYFQVLFSIYLSHLANTEHIEVGGIEGLHIEFLWPQGLNDHRLSCPGHVSHGEISRNRKHYKDILKVFET